MTAQTSMIKGRKSFFPRAAERDASMSCGDCGEVCIGMNAIIICGKRWLLRMARFAVNPAGMCHRAHTVFLAARAALFAGSANPHGIKRFMYGRLRAIEKSAAPGRRR